MTTSERRQIQDWIKEAEKQGWSVIMGTRGARHWKWFRPDGSLGATSPSTPGGGNRSLDNVRAKLRRAGLRLPR